MVQNNTVVFGWNRAVPGREGLAGELFGVAMAYYEKLRASNSIQSYEAIFLDRHGGDLNGFFLIKGTHAQIDTMLSSDEFRDLVFRADHYLQGVGVITGYHGNPINDLMQTWIKTIPAK
jgi:hypothetical protein